MGISPKHNTSSRQHCGDVNLGFQKSTGVPSLVLWPPPLCDLASGPQADASPNSQVSQPPDPEGLLSISSDPVSGIPEWLSDMH